MRAVYRSLIASFIAVVLIACGAAQEEAKEPMPVADTVFGDTVGALDKARAVEATTQERKQEIDRALEESQGEH